MNENNRSSSGNSPDRNPQKRNTAARSSMSPAINGKAGNSAQPHKKKKRKKNKVLMVIKKFFSIILTTIMSLFLIMIITGTIVATALTVYVLDFMEETTGVTFQELEQSYDTVFYATDKETGEYVNLQTIKTGGTQRIPVSIDKIPQHVRDTFVYTEDERFYTHEGVDYKRTFSAFLNMFIHIYDTDQGGSTITQQLVKNLTGDDEKSPSRKIREIFKAMELEKRYSKDEILEQYLNFIGFGGPINGIQLASIRYFGKDVSELTTAEAACLAAIPKNPNKYYPFAHKTDPDTGEVILDGKANNRERQQYVLWQVYKNGAITYDEYQQCLNEKLLFTDTEEYLALHPEDAAKDLEKENDAYPWPVEVAIMELQEYLCEQFNIDKYEARKRINRGGYKIYLTVDLEMQEYVDEKFSDINNLMDGKKVMRKIDLNDDGELDEDYPQAGFVAMNYEGEILALGGAIGKKMHDLVNSYAYNEPRQIGSTMKPISTYGLALLNDTIHWGSVYQDKAVLTIDGAPWPTNYSTDGHFSVSGKAINVYYAIQKSYNTVPAKLCQDLTPNAVFKFATENLGLELHPKDEAYSPLSVGALTYGVTVSNLVNAYLPYGNDGTYYKAHIIRRVEQGDHNLVYENNGDPHEAVDSQTAWVMNRLLKNVVDHGTGTKAKLKNIELAGKTGTTNDWRELTFVGLTPDFVSGVLIGYRKPGKLPSSINSGAVWKKIIGDYIETHNTQSSFTPDPDVISGAMCTASGKMASSSCPKGIVGYWKSSNCPVCTGGHVVAPPEGEEEGGENAEGGNNEAGGGEGGNNQGGEAQPQPQPQPQQPAPENNGGGGEAPAAPPAE